MQGLQLLQVLEQTPETIRYRVADTELGSDFELVEFAPEHLARRRNDGSLEVAENGEASFQEARDTFRTRARLSGAVEHPALVRVLRLM